MTGIPSELSEPALAASMDLALRRLVGSDLSDREWTLFEGRLDGVSYVASCMQENGIGVHATLAQINEQRKFNWLARQENRNDLVREMRSAQPPEVWA